jgi:hypothetical protein
MVSILDVENVGIMDLRGEALEFLKAASKVWVGLGFGLAWLGLAWCLVCCVGD